jgi:hypothetical protein
MKKTKIAIVLGLAILAGVLGVCLVVYLNWSQVEIEWKYLEVLPPAEVYYSRFLNHSEAWNRVFGNVSTIKEFWNTTIPSSLSGKSIPQIAQMYGAEVYVNDPEYATCHIRVSKLNYQALNETLAHLGFYVRDVVSAKLLTSHINTGHNAIPVCPMHALA